MKTIESVLKSIRKDKQKCHNCDVEEGAEHPLKGMTVVIKKDEKSGNNYCQICLIEKSDFLETEKKEQMLGIIQKFCFAVVTMVTLSASVMAQPGLPSTPDQAPIDGGLGLLAVAGGVYAYKKLKKR